MWTNAEYVRRQNEIDTKIQCLEGEKIKVLKNLKMLRQEKEELRIQYALHRLKNRPGAAEWLNKNYSWTEKVYEVLKEIFGFDEFRPNQLAAINATLSKKDVLLIMPTGGGKSLVYYLPTLITGNLSVVISPLLALIEDQLMALRRMGISAATLNSNLTREEKKVVTTSMLANKLNLVFVTPEWLARNKLFMNNLTKLYKEGRLARIVIDEVHCCSQWGHDFRNDYLSLSMLKGQFAGVPILGLTATATSSVMIDVQKILQVPDAVIISSPFNRPNLFYKVNYKPECKAASIDFLEYALKNNYYGQSGIIYAGTQKDCEDIASKLKERAIRAAPYHANLEADVKNKIHRKWTENSYQVIVATIAFGMGIDKPDVRFVIHYTVPKTLEGLYQESGRAGRDGENADCILMFNLNDWLKNFANCKSNKEENSVADVLDYCTDTSTCRRQIISKYFDDDWQASDCQRMCDHCRSRTESIHTYNIISCVREVLCLIDMAYKKEMNFTLKKLVDSWFQIGPKNLQSSSSKPQFTRDQAEEILAFLLSKKFLTVRRGYSLISTLAYIETNNDNLLVQHEDKVLMDYCGILKGVPVYVENIKSPECSVSSCASNTSTSSHASKNSLVSNTSYAFKSLTSKTSLASQSSHGSHASDVSETSLEYKISLASDTSLVSNTSCAPQTSLTSDTSHVSITSCETKISRASKTSRDSKTSCETKTSRRSKTSRYSKNSRASKNSRSSQSSRGSNDSSISGICISEASNRIDLTMDSESEGGLTQEERSAKRLKVLSATPLEGEGSIGS